MDKSVEAGSSLSCRQGRVEVEWGVTADGRGVSFGGDENILKSIAMPVA